MDLITFWRTYFPESKHFAERDQVLQQIDDARRGLLNTTASDSDMIAYQNDVARIYGQYEPIHMQAANGRLIAKTMECLSVSKPSHILSLGSGPGSYEIITASITPHHFTFTLVDHAARMIERSRFIARDMQVADRFKWIESDVVTAPLPFKCADMIWCINSMHWSPNWPMWIDKMFQCSKPGCHVYAQFTVDAPRSKITLNKLYSIMKRFFTIIDSGLLIPPQPMADGRIGIQKRVYVIAKRKFG